MPSSNQRDLFSRFVNWLSSSGQDTPPISRNSRDLFSRLMNRISG
ncbi:ferredoxin--nitrite reductase [Synechococcus sp. LA31]|jgi:hypothetical protein|nr:ferredoxin--nitrite reductase [Synechococcus sp. LA31]QVV67195.1 ferredoxin--nitrite reductase [Synechococcus sp. LA31]